MILLKQVVSWNCFHNRAPIWSRVWVNPATSWANLYDDWQVPATYERFVNASEKETLLLHHQKYRPNHTCRNQFRIILYSLIIQNQMSQIVNYEIEFRTWRHSVEISIQGLFDRLSWQFCTLFDKGWQNIGRTCNQLQVGQLMSHDVMTVFVDLPPSSQWHSWLTSFEVIFRAQYLIQLRKIQLWITKK